MECDHQSGLASASKNLPEDLLRSLLIDLDLLRVGYMCVIQGRPNSNYTALGQVLNVEGLAITRNLAMGALTSRAANGLDKDEVRRVCASTGFGPRQVQRLYMRFKYLDNDNKGYLTRADLMGVKEVILNPVGERIVEVFFKNCDDAEMLEFEDFAKVIAVFRPCHNKQDPQRLNSRENKIKMLFSMIQNDSGHFGQDEVVDLLELMLGASVGEEHLPQIAARVIAEADSNEDGLITLDEFKEAVRNLDVEGGMSFISLK